MSEITKKQMKTLMKDVKDGRILKKVLCEEYKQFLFCSNASLKSTIIRYNLEKHNINTKEKEEFKNHISRLLGERDYILGRKPRKVIKVSNFRGSDGGDSSLTHIRITRRKWKERNAEMARYEGLGALWCGTPLCEDIIGEIMSYL